VTSHVSHPYKSTDFTQALKILILVSFRIDVDSHTFLSLEKFVDLGIHYAMRMRHIVLSSVSCLALQ
jgi:hypothetical protein